MHESTGHYSLPYETWIDLVLVTFEFFVEVSSTFSFIRCPESAAYLKYSFLIRTAAAMKCYFESAL